MNTDNWICIEDFCGTDSGRPLSFWADWDPDTKHVYFGGVWWEIPPMPAEELPEEIDVKTWVKDHGGKPYGETR